MSGTATAAAGRAAGAPPAGISCWAQSTHFQVELTPALLPAYMREVRPTQAVLDAWAGMQARGLPWIERYAKHARVELLGGHTDDTRTTTAITTAVTTAIQTAFTRAQASPMAIDMLLALPLQPLRVGDTADVQVLRDGAPLADFAVEWRTERSPLGIWQRTDAEGRVRLLLPLPGQWLLRGIDLRLSDSVPDSFDSRFISLAFEVAPRAAAPAAPAAPAAR